MTDTFREWEADWMGAFRAQGHTPFQNKHSYPDEDPDPEWDENVDVFRLSHGFHNGPECSSCGYAVCMHCVSRDKIEPCVCPSDAGTPQKDKN